MKKLLLIVFMGLILASCSETEIFRGRTITNNNVMPVKAQHHADVYKPGDTVWVYIEDGLIVPHVNWNKMSESNVFCRVVLDSIQ